jgi:serine phosphatase RsbU (regulator of sigma subunit)
LLYTDGLIEGRVDGGDERLGSERLVELVASGMPEAGGALITRLIATAEGLNGGDLADDVALLVVSAS